MRLWYQIMWKFCFKAKSATATISFASRQIERVEENEGSFKL